MEKDVKDFKGFYFKSKIILVDDNESFLDNLSFKLSNSYTVETFSDPEKAKEAIISSYENDITSVTQNFLTEIENEDEEAHYSVDFSKIISLSENENKKETVSVVIVDYSMPLINGIEFCKKIAHLPILKIILTGYADFKVAVDAFNEGIIDRFLVKDSPLMLEETIKEINAMQELFFEKLSYPLLPHFSVKRETLLTSKEYIGHFNEIIHNINACEFYLFNPLGSYLLLDEKGSKFYFIVLLDKQLDEYIDLAKDMNADPELIKRMIVRTHAPIFIEENDYKLPVSDWNCLLQPLQKANGYYYCVLSGELRNTTKLANVI
ncbi:Two component response regulator [Legionella nautarum]|uniref:Two component response regulator n=1 Tax=Legionella nautarum TaxID=45070 RepID=A0A0W0WMM5_9GAMM|nr:response regulator [Legionella nautarum]KTD33564.1 Two component response regulator [Legionella nautarum]